MINVRDMTEHQKLEQAQNQNEMLNALTANVSHEMMTPLNCIILFAVHILVACEGNLDITNKAEIIEKSAKILKLNLRDLLDRSLLSKGKFEVNLENLSILLLVQETVDLMRTYA
jgi:signal transduction histidine kinase